MVFDECSLPSGRRFFDHLTGIVTNCVFNEELSESNEYPGKKGYSFLINPRVSAATISLILV